MLAFHHIYMISTRHLKNMMQGLVSLHLYILSNIEIGFALQELTLLQ